MSISLPAITSQLTAEIRRRFDDEFARASRLLAHSLNVHSFHAIIGCRNNDYVDVVGNQFSDPMPTSDGEQSPQADVVLTESSGPKAELP